MYLGPRLLPRGPDLCLQLFDISIQMPKKHLQLHIPKTELQYSFQMRPSYTLPHRPLFQLLLSSWKTRRVPPALLFLSQHGHNLKGNTLDLTSKVSYIRTQPLFPASAANTVIRAATTSSLDYSPAPKPVSQSCFPPSHLQLTPSSAQQPA